MKTLLAALLVAAAPLVHAVTGSGVIKTETRPVSGFTAIASAGSVKLVLRQGSREGLELRGDDNVLPLIETRLVSRDGVTTLEIGTKRGESYTTREPVVATVDLVTLRALALAGSGSVSCDALKTTTLLVASSGSNQLKLHQLAADELRLKVSGSGDVELSGRAGAFALNIAGSGNANARALEADNVTVGIAGSGDATVNAHKTLAVSVAGSGNVAYTGGAMPTASIAGSGRVKKL